MLAGGGRSSEVGEVLSTCAVVGGGGWVRVVMRQQGSTRECRRGWQGMGGGTRGWGEARCVVVAVGVLGYSAILLT